MIYYLADTISITTSLHKHAVRIELARRAPCVSVDE